MEAYRMTFEFWSRLFLASLVVVGIWTIFRKEMVLGGIGEWANKNLPAFIYKPTIGCLPCLSSIHGSWIWFFLGGDLKLWPVFLLALCGLLKIVTVKLFSN